METIVCQSFESFIDMCNNNLVKGKNIHCTFDSSNSNVTYSIMKYEFDKMGGVELTRTIVFKDKNKV
ncbi:hypothetical protein BCU71_06230 [Vibrio lentus]|nr:hypothetical protein BCU96_03440 [Vibrio lentus]PMH08720.1 hypothetical protein BCU76_05080 [Vibrio lentus]PMH28165.1 hypothetical protein BCU71_06230 [Vibrio lentus]PMJ05270.1 hypothetical protein BCU31_06800 [Vibrio lentus]PMJ14533.1 hypothetical protein BCU30_01530 [Vibrio lentus]